MTQRVAKQIAEAKQAIANLLNAIERLQDDAASEETLQPYRGNLAAWHARLAKLERGAK